MNIIRAMVATAALAGSLMAVQTQFASAAPAPIVNGDGRFIAAPVHASVPEAKSNPVAFYRVKSGDTLSGIAKSHKTTWQGLYCENKAEIGGNPDFIKPGERFEIPTHRVTCKIVQNVQNVQNVSINNTSATSSSSATQQPPVVTTYVPQGLSQLQAYALSLLGGNTGEYSCLDNIVMAESSWDIYAQNPSGAYGIPQALPGSKMSAAGSDWATNGETQLRWMIQIYIPATYGTMCNAWAFHQANGWY